MWKGNGRCSIGAYNGGKGALTIIFVLVYFVSLCVMFKLKIDVP